MVGATPWKIKGVLSHKVLKIRLIQEIIHFSVFLYQYIILLASLIYFWKGVSRPQRPPGSAPDICLPVINTCHFNSLQRTRFLISTELYHYLTSKREIELLMVLLFIRLEEVQNYGIYPHLKKPCFTVLHQTLVYICVGTYLMTHNRIYIDAIM